MDSTSSKLPKLNTQQTTRVAASDTAQRLKKQSLDNYLDPIIDIAGLKFPHYFSATIFTAVNLYDYSWWMGISMDFMVSTTFACGLPCFAETQVAEPPMKKAKLSESLQAEEIP